MNVTAKRSTRQEHLAKSGQHLGLSQYHGRWNLGLEHEPHVQRTQAGPRGEVLR